MEKKSRDMNFELLRIISMLLIISSHYIIHSGILETLNIFTFNYFFIDFVRALSRISVGLYVLITGYYMVKSKIKVKKLFNTWTIVLFYSLIMCLISILIKENVGIKGIIKSFMPISSGLYWFATVYVALYTLAPFINILVNRISKNQYKILLIILFLYLVIDKTIFIGNNYIDARNGESLIWFVFLYLVAGYIRLYLKMQINKKLLIGITIIIPLIIVLLRFLSIKYFDKSLLSLFNFSNILNFTSLICFFLYFREIKIKNEKINNIIGKIAPLTFGIYLIHDNVLFKYFMWKNIFKVSEFANKPYLILHFVFTVLTVFVICGLIELIRTKVWQLFDKTKIVKKVNKMLDQINEKFWSIMEEKNDN